MGTVVFSDEWSTGIGFAEYSGIIPPGQAIAGRRHFLVIYGVSFPIWFWPIGGGNFYSQ